MVVLMTHSRYSKRMRARTLPISDNDDPLAATRFPGFPRWSSLVDIPNGCSKLMPPADAWDSLSGTVVIIAVWPAGEIGQISDCTVGNGRSALMPAIRMWPTWPGLDLSDGVGAGYSLFFPQTRLKWSSPPHLLHF